MNETATLIAANPDLMQIEEFFEQNYLFRNNVLNGRYEVARVGQNPRVWQHLTNERWNSIVWNLEMALPDVKSLKKYAEMYVYSEHTPLYDPIAEYMNKLPAWDGKDHVGNLINSLAGVNEKQSEWIRIWLRSMVTHWMRWMWSTEMMWCCCSWATRAVANQPSVNDCFLLHFGSIISTI